MSAKNTLKKPWFPVDFPSNQAIKLVVDHQPVLSLVSQVQREQVHCLRDEHEWLARKPMAVVWIDMD